MLEAQDFLRRITRDELRVIMLKDVAGFNRASNLVLDDLTAVFLTENPDWQFRREFEKIMKNNSYALIGKVLSGPEFVVKGKNGKKLIETTVNDLQEHYQKTFQGY